MSGEAHQIEDWIEDSYPLSPVQQGMLYHSVSAQTKGVEIEQVVGDLSEELDVCAFETAWALAVARHPVLRSAFRWDGLNEPVQEVRRQVKLDWTRQDWRGLSASAVEERLRNYLETDRQRGFEMNSAPLMRMAVFWVGHVHYRFVWTFHHALLDGRSFVLVLREVFALYESLRQGENLELPPPPVFSEHIQWLERQDWTKAEPFWRRTLKGFRAPNSLLPDRLLNAEERTGGARDAEELRLSAASTARLQTFATEQGVTLNTLVQGAWALLLARYGGEDDVVFGATRACRRSSVSGADATAGLFINTVPLRVKVDGSRTVSAWLQGIRRQWIALRDYEHTPLVRIQNWSEIPPGSSLFESLVIFENATLDAWVRASGAAWLRRHFHLFEQAYYPLTLAAYGDADLLLKIQFDGRQFEPANIRRRLAQLQRVLETFAEQPDQRLEEISILTETERVELLEQWNPARVESRPGATLPELFEAQVERTPHAVALVCDGRALSYDELNRRANRLAHELQNCGVGPEILVGVCLERSSELVVALLAILKAGGAYVPIDLSYPPERVAFILRDTRTPVLVTQEKLADRLPAHQAKVIFVDQRERSPVAGNGSIRPEVEANPRRRAQAENLAYVIYTSGSTGSPKGVLVTHHNVVRLFQATDDWFRFNRTDVWTLFHSYAFDFSVWELWGALLYGGKLVVVPYTLSRSPEEFLELLLRERVTVLNQTPSAFGQLMQADLRSGSADGLALRCVIFGGEALDLAALKPWLERHGDQRPQLVNMFGITETTVHVTYRPVAHSDVGQRSVIGLPIPDLQVYVLDHHLRPAPMGVPGELYVGGAGLGRGYLHRPELTAERFIPHPFSAAPGARLYRTGDLGRWLPNRDLEYLGRADDQVKIRGFRVELGEIEAVLAEHPAVREAVVLVREETPGDKRLVGCLVTEQPAPALNALRDFVRAKLPEYMVPGGFVLLDSFPLTTNGKIDRRALAKLEARRGESESLLEQPGTEMERKVAEVWQRVLRVSQVGLDGNFFELGGNSLLLVQAHSQLRSVLKKDLPITKLFQYPTVRSLARFLSELSDAEPALQKAQERASRHTEALARRAQWAEIVKR